MKKRDQTVLLLEKYIHLFRCPICKGEMDIREKSMLCENKHTFDVAKKGYINLYMQSSPEQYDKELFEARHRVIAGGLYQPLHEKITTVIKSHFQIKLHILDVGSGEGSHLHEIMKRIDHINPQGFGIDISKDGIMTAAKYYPEAIWCVGDLAKNPFQESSFHVLFNILSPANYEEFDRISTKDAVVIKVVPQQNYLKEIREIISSEPSNYSNDETVNKFQEHYSNTEIHRLTYKQEINNDLRIPLWRMTPLTWNTDYDDVKGKIDKLTEVTIDLDILIGSHAED